jgi:hypothetical protein
MINLKNNFPKLLFEIYEISATRCVLKLTQRVNLVIRQSFLILSVGK